MVNLRDTFVVIRNDSIEVTPTEPLSYPLYNFCAVKISVDASRKNISSIEAFYKFGQNEEDVIEAGMIDLSHTHEYIEARGFSLQEKVLNHTSDWSDRDAARLLGSLTMPDLEKEGVSRDQLILDAFTASLGVYLAFVELSRQKDFWSVAPLPFSFTVPTDNNPFATGVLHHYLHPARVCSIIGQNEMGTNLTVSVVEFVNIWGGMFKTTPLRHDLEPIISETVMGFEDYLLTQIDRASKATETFDTAVGQMNEMLERLRQQFSGGDHAVLTAAIDRVSRYVDAQITKKVPAIVNTATTEVVSSIKQSFQRYLSEVYRGYDKVLTDQIDDMAKKAVGEFKLQIDRKITEGKTIYGETKKLHDDVALALKELRGMPTEIAQLKKNTERLPNIESRLDALEAQISRLISRTH